MKGIEKMGEAEKERVRKGGGGGRGGGGERASILKNNWPKKPTERKKTQGNNNRKNMSQKGTKWRCVVEKIRCHFVQTEL